VSTTDRTVRWAIGAAIAMAIVPAQAQSNLDAGKSAAQIFADTCNACHRSPRQLRPTHAGFLREHYTTGMREAAAMAAYLASVGNDPRAVQQRRPPVLGAGNAATPDTAPRSPDQARNPETQAALPGAAPGRRAAPEQPGPSATPAVAVKPRRPSESVEAGNLPVDSVQTRAADAAPAQTTAAAPRPANTLEEFEE
jgi:hypothetical protein